MNVFRKILCPVDPARGARGWADLIVMGTHGLSGFERLLLGSVTAKILAVAGPRAQAPGAVDRVPASPEPSPP
jgi:hypothetical protein